ncbi:HAD family hydrolase [Marinilabilia salmonicolor]|uniref:HAD family hydrolase n=1 Tax=Marinilabilia salmonicolor TaxID=989 RepID=UPI00029A016C|nr:HAD hydrolase-like protein [Marinilabilia salmonicolor]
MSYKHIIFDLDGTLLDTESADMKSLQEVLQEVQDKEFSIDELRFVLGIPMDKALKALKVEDVDYARSLWTMKFETHFSEVKLFPGVVDLIDSIKKMGLEVGIITSKTREEYINDFLPFSLSNEFSISLCIDDYRIAKPSSEGMRMYLNVANLKAQEVLFIGDTIYDFGCADGIGADFGLAKWGSSGLKGTDAKYIFNAPEDVLFILNIIDSGEGII